MWPREVYDLGWGKGYNPVVRKRIMEELKDPGVYVLYRDDQPYYIGKTKRPLHERIYAHANMSRDAYYNFWNFFSAFVVPDNDHLGEVEGILIASMPTANSAKPRIRRINVPREVAAALQGYRKAKLRA